MFIKLYQSHTPNRIPPGQTCVLRINARLGYIPYAIHLNVHGIQFLHEDIMYFCIGLGERSPMHLNFERSIDRHLIKVYII